MADVESGALSWNGRKRPSRCLAGVAFVAIALSGSGCSMIDQFNPFGGADKYKMEITPDVPASKTYDDGLNKLANGSPSEAAKKFTDLGKQYPSSDWAQKGLLMQTYADYQAGDYTSAETSAERFLKDYKGTVVAVTHDRYFLDNVAGWILELDRGRGIPWEGNYSSWLEQKSNRLKQEEKAESRKQQTLERELEGP